MRIKLFENFKTEDYYQVLGSMGSNVEYERLRSFYYTTYTDEVEMKRIGDEINSMLIGELDYPDQTRKKEGGYWVGYRNDTRMPFSSRGNHICIWYREDFYRAKIKWEIFMMPDEYFLVQEIIQVYAGGDAKVRYYKCDQFEGLVKLLKDKKLIK
jgi:hypothetical protein